MGVGIRKGLSKEEMFRLRPKGCQYIKKKNKETIEPTINIC